MYYRIRLHRAKTFLLLFLKITQTIQEQERAPELQQAL